MRLPCIAIALTFLITSCSDDLSMDVTSVPAPAATDNEGFTFPHSSSFKPTVFSRSGSSFEEDWENWTSYPCPGREPLPLPWIGYVEGSAQDNIKKKDGWVMAFHNLDSNTAPQHYIMGFYNEYSGEFKYLFHVTDVLSHSACTPKIGITYNDYTIAQALLNTSGELSIGSSQKLVDYWVHAGLQNSEMLSTGWNCVDVPMSYDPAFPSNARITVDPTRGVSETTYEFMSQSQSETEGSIVSMTSSGNNYSGSIAKLVGDKAGGWMVNTFGSIIGNIATSGVSSLVKVGINLLTNSFFGSHSSQQVHQVRLSTKTTGRITGTSTTITTTGAAKMSVLINKDVIGMELGSWNLAENPTIYMHPIGVLTSAPYGCMSDENDYMFRATNKYKLDLVINPELKNKLTKYWVECVPVLYFPDNTTSLPVSPASTIDVGSLNDQQFSAGHWNYTSNHVGAVNGITVYKAPLIDIWTSIFLWSKYGKPEGDNPVYKYLYAPGNEDYIRGDDKFSSRNLYAKVSLYMVRDLDGKADTLIHTRTYQPKLEWDPDIVRRCSNYGFDMQYIQYLGSIDPLLAEIDNKSWEKLGKKNQPLTINETDKEQGNDDKEGSSESE